MKKTTWMVMGILSVGIVADSQAAKAPRTGPVLSKPIPLLDENAREIFRELERSKFKDETFSLVVECNRYKKGVRDARAERLNCYVTGVTPEPVVERLPASQKNQKR